MDRRLLSSIAAARSFVKRVILALRPLCAILFFAADQVAFACVNCLIVRGGTLLDQRKKRVDGWGCLVGLILIVLVGFVGWRWTRYQAWLKRIPAGVTLAGVPVEGTTPKEAVERLVGAYSGPITLHYRDQRLSLSPQAVDFSIDVEATRSALDAQLDENRDLETFLAYLVGQYPPPVDIPVDATYSPEALQSALENVAREYDRQAKPPVPQLSTGSYIPGEPGYHLDIAESAPDIIQALMSTAEREAHLVVQVEEPPPPDISLLQAIVENQLSDFEGVASVFFKDLQTGDEININTGVAYAGMSIVKIAIMEEAYRQLDQAPDLATVKLLTETMTLSGNFTANQLLRLTGDGDPYQGIQRLNSSMRKLGLINTFMATPYDEEVVPPTIVTPANSRTDIDTNPDPYMQTTPLDMGLLLEMLYYCSQGGGALMSVYPDDFSTDECQAMIDHMLGNQLSGEEGVPVLIAAGVPLEVPVAHKHGWVADTRADAALIFTPGGDYVLVIYLYSPGGWVDWDQTNALMSSISQAVYLYFNPPTGS